MATRPTRFLLRNGQDYLTLQEYARALTFFKAADARKGELSDPEIQSLKRGIAQAQQGLREAVNSPRILAQGKAKSVVQPGSFALARAAKAPTDTVQRTSVDLPSPSPRKGPSLPSTVSQSVAMADLDGSPAPVAVQTVVPAVAMVVQAPASSSGVELPPLPDSPEVSTPAAPALPILPAQGPSVDPAALPAQLPSPVELPPTTPTPLPSEPPPPLILESSSPIPRPSDVPMPTQAELPSVELPPSSPAAVELPPAQASPPLPMPVEPAPAQLPSLPGSVEPAVVAEAAQRPDSSAPSQPASLPEPPPAAEAPPSGNSGTVPSMPVYPAPPATIPNGPPPAILSERVAREVEQIAQQSRDRTLGGAPADPNDPTAVQANPGSPRLAIERAPSPTEARPLRRIPVPEENVNLGKRDWEPNRKYWAAAGTCHMILYFQDPVLERYGQSAEQALGPWGRYFTYPLDDPKQSNQRNQILQPFYSMGKFCFQVGTLPYKLVVDPPWEAEYDLGYYRPGDRIPPDTIYITPFGVGPPLKGRNY
jgi:hypothetical protein